MIPVIFGVTVTGILFKLALDYGRRIEKEPLSDSRNFEYLGINPDINLPDKRVDVRDKLTSMSRNKLKSMDDIILLKPNRMMGDRNGPYIKSSISKEIIEKLKTKTPIPFSQNNEINRVTNVTLDENMMNFNGNRFRYPKKENMI